MSALSGPSDDTAGLYPQLPPLLEIRETDHEGRGLWTLQHSKPGMYDDLKLLSQANLSGMSRVRYPGYRTPCIRPLKSIPRFTLFIVRECLDVSPHAMLWMRDFKVL